MKFLENGSRPQPPTSPQRWIYTLTHTLLSHAQIAIVDTHLHVYKHAYIHTSVHMYIYARIRKYTHRFAALKTELATMTSHNTQLAKAQRLIYTLTHTLLSHAQIAIVNTHLHIYKHTCFCTYVHICTYT